MPIYLNATTLDERVAAAGLTLGQFAMLAEISPTTLSRARNGHPLRTATLRRIAKALILHAAPMRGMEGLVVGRAGK